jgi:hypothetical protein
MYGEQVFFYLQASQEGTPGSKEAQGMSCGNSLACSAPGNAPTFQVIHPCTLLEDVDLLLFLSFRCRI